MLSLLGVWFWLDPSIASALDAPGALPPPSVLGRSGPCPFWYSLLFLVRSIRAEHSVTSGFGTRLMWRVVTNVALVPPSAVWCSDIQPSCSPAISSGALCPSTLALSHPWHSALGCSGTPALQLTQGYPPLKCSASGFGQDTLALGTRPRRSSSLSSAQLLRCLTTQTLPLQHPLGLPVYRSDILAHGAWLSRLLAIGRSSVRPLRRSAIQALWRSAAPSLGFSCASPVQRSAARVLSGFLGAWLFWCSPAFIARWLPTLGARLLLRSTTVAFGQSITPTRLLLPPSANLSCLLDCLIA